MTSLDVCNTAVSAPDPRGPFNSPKGSQDDLLQRFASFLGVPSDGKRRKVVNWKWVEDTVKHGKPMNWKDYEIK